MATLLREFIEHLGARDQAQQLRRRPTSDVRWFLVDVGPDLRLQHWTLQARNGCIYSFEREVISREIAEGLHRRLRPPRNPLLPMGY